jgi:hypothetical protein
LTESSKHCILYEKPINPRKEIFMLPFLKILAMTPTVLFYPPDVLTINRPDSVVTFDSTNTKTGKDVCSYTDQGWLLSVQTLDAAGKELNNSSAEYSWKGDTLCVKFNYSNSPDHDSVKCVISASGFPVKEWHYDNMGLVEISTYVYSASGKLIKELIQNNLNYNFGDSIVYAYGLGDMLKSQTQYGDTGKVWSYTAFTCDASARPSRAIFYDCDSVQCMPTGYYGVFYYSKNAIRNPVFSGRPTMNPISWHQNNNQLFLTSNRPDLCIADTKIFDVSGALITSFKARNGHYEVVPFSSRLNQIYLLTVNTDKGRFTFKINM